MQSCFSRSQITAISRRWSDLRTLRSRDSGSSRTPRPLYSILRSRGSGLWLRKFPLTIKCARTAERLMLGFTFSRQKAGSAARCESFCVSKIMGKGSGTALALCAGDSHRDGLLSHNPCHPSDTRRRNSFSQSIPHDLKMGRLASSAALIMSWRASSSTHSELSGGMPRKFASTISSANFCSSLGRRRNRLSLNRLVAVALSRSRTLG